METEGSGVMQVYELYIMGGDNTGPCTDFQGKLGLRATMLLSHRHKAGVREETLVLKIGEY